MLHTMRNSKSDIPRKKSTRKKTLPCLGLGYSNLGLFLLSLFLLCGCASTSDLDSMRAEINQLKRESFELKKETAEIRKQASSSVREDSFSAVRESQASLLSQVNEQSRELQVLSGRFDEYKFFMDKAMKEGAAEREVLRAQINALELRVKELSEKVARTVEAKPPPQEQKPADEESEEEAVEPKKPEESPATAVYESAYAAFKGKKYKDAREKFSAFIKKFPKDSLAGNAHFWIGESYYAEKDFENAILSYESVIKGFPQNVKIPVALYKQGLAFMELGDKKTAKVIFEKLVEKFPDSPEAAQAKKKKAEIDKKPVKKGTR